MSNNYEDIDWSDGMLLKAIHFNILKDKNYFMAYKVLKTVVKISFGVISYSYDENLISEGIIYITQITAIMPSGSVIDCNDNIISRYPDSFKIDLNKYKVENDDIFYVFLCVKKHQNNENENRDRIVVCKGEEYISSDGMSENINFITPLPKFSNDSSSNLYEYIPILKINKKQNRFINMTYVPPSIIFNSNNLLILRIKNMINQIYSRVINKYNHISQNISNKTINTDTIIDMRNFDIIFISLQKIYTLLGGDTILIYDLYNLLLDFNIALGLICLNIVGINIVYNHLKMYELFDALCYKAEISIPSIFSTNSTLECFNENNILPKSISCLIDEDFAVDDNSFYIQCIYDVSIDKSIVINYLNNMTIVSESVLQETMKLRICGIERNVVNSSSLNDKIAAFKLSNALYIVCNAQSKYFKKNEHIILVLSDNIKQICKFNLIKIKG